MKSKRLFAAMGGIDDSFISEDAEAASFAGGEKKSKPFYQKRTALRYAGIAACAAVVLICVWAIPALLNTPQINTTHTTDRPILHWSEQF